MKGVLLVVLLLFVHSSLGQDDPGPAPLSIDVQARNLTVDCESPSEFDGFIDTQGGAHATSSNSITWSASSYTEPVGACASETVVFTVTDDVTGEFAITTATYTVEDRDRPMIGARAYLSTTVECDLKSGASEEALNEFIDTLGGQEVTDNCHTVEELTLYGEVGSEVTWGVLDCMESYGIVFYATDPCGNQEQETGRFNIVDTQPPEFVQEAQMLTMDCSVDPFAEYQAWLDANGGAVATDLCIADDDQLAWATDAPDTLPGTCSASGQAIFHVMDDCGLQISTTAAFGLVDTTPPMFTNTAQDMEVSCDASTISSEFDNWIASNGRAAAEDLCGNVSFQNDNSGVPELLCEPAVVTFTATDDCSGLTSSSVATFSIIDEVAPDITGTTDMVVECDGAGNTADYENFITTRGGSTAVDNCSPSESIVWTNDAEGPPTPCTADSSVTVEFVATDPCGNSASVTASYTVRDTTAPVFESNPENEFAECDLKNGGSQAALFAYFGNHGNAVVSDTCAPSESLVFRPIVPPVYPSLCSTSGAFNFVVSDPCFNSASASGSFSIRDTTDPVITKQPDNLVLACSSNARSEFEAWLDSAGSAEATDACVSDDSQLVWSNDYEGVLDGCSESGTVVFTVTDTCGLSSSTEASYSLDDNTAPVITEADDLVVQCDGTGNANDFVTWIEDNGGATASDDCGIVSFTSSIPDEILVECGSISVTFTAEEDCSGLTAETTASFTIIDEVAPFFEQNPQSVIEECSAETVTAFDAWLVDGFASASDVCYGETGTTVTNDFASTFAAFCNNVITVEFFANDGCGNVSPGETATFTVIDATDPVFESLPMNMVVDCDTSITVKEDWIAAFGGAVVEDACDSDLQYLVETHDESVDPCSNSETYQFTAVDACGNSAFELAMFEFADLDGPEFVDEPADATFECDGSSNVNQQIEDWLSANGGAEVIDVCQGESATFTFDNNYSSELAHLSCMSRNVTFTVTDECGNASSRSAFVSYNDGTCTTFCQECNSNESCDQESETCVNRCDITDCSDNQFCDETSGECVSVCDNLNCGDGEFCDEITGSCFESCDIECESFEYCDPQQNACANRCEFKQCAVNEICDPSSGICTNLCSFVSCRENEVCDRSSGLCINNCAINNPCEPVCDGNSDEICNSVSGECVLASACSICMNNELCDELTGLCENKCETIDCINSNEECDVSIGACVNVCDIAGTCQSNELCDTETGSCSNKCESLECNDNSLCDESVGACVNKCQSLECSENEVCNEVTGACVGTCGDPCGSYQVCDFESGECINKCEILECNDFQNCNEITGKCVNKCDDEVCEENEVCDRSLGACVDECDVVECEENETCTIGALCVNSCEVLECESNEVCDETLGDCVNACTTIECQSNETCDEESGSCVNNCVFLLCGQNEFCDETAGACENNCAVRDCPTGTVCDEFTDSCVGECEASECPSNEYCVSEGCANLCDIRDCGDHEFCDTSVGECVSRCDVTVCPENEYCEESTGLCTSLCEIMPCEISEFCVENTLDCVNFCEILVCDSNELCNNDLGMCENACKSIECDQNEVCDNDSGSCVNRCTILDCEEDVCDPDLGECVNLCADTPPCGVDRACDRSTGECVDTCSFCTEITLPGRLTRWKPYTPACIDVAPISERGKLIFVTGENEEFQITILRNADLSSGRVFIPFVYGVAPGEVRTKIILRNGVEYSTETFLVLSPDSTEETNNGCD